MLTHFSYDLIMLPLRKFADWRQDQDFTHSDIDWMADYTFIRHKDAALGLEISKRYARAIMSRNNSSVALVLAMTSVISRQCAEFSCSCLYIRHMVNRGFSRATCRKLQRNYEVLMRHRRKTKVRPDVSCNPPLHE